MTFITCSKTNDWKTK